MAYNNNFPVGYQPAQIYYPQQFQPQMPMQGQNPQPQAPQQPLTPPTIHADIIQVDNEQVAESHPLSAGSSQMMIAKDDSAIFIKTMYPNGQYKLDVYTRRPESSRSSGPKDSDLYVTREEFEKRIKEISDSYTARRIEEEGA